MDKVTAARIASLREAPAWEDLTKFLLDLEHNYWMRVLAEMRLGKEKAKPVDQRQIDYCRGLSDGIRQILTAPDKAARIYERKQEVTVEE